MASLTPTPPLLLSPTEPRIVELQLPQAVKENVIETGGRKA